MRIALASRREDSLSRLRGATVAVLEPGAPRVTQRCYDPPISSPRVGERDLPRSDSAGRTRSRADHSHNAGPSDDTNDTDDTDDTHDGAGTERDNDDSHDAAEHDAAAHAAAQHAHQ